jgi:predicted nucleotidyltransferase
MTGLESLAEELGVHERTLRRAVAAGALRASRPTPRTLELPLSERRYARRSWPLIAALRESLRTQRNVRFAMLFGSAATGTDLPTSDLDVLVELLEDSLDSLLDLSRKLTTDTGRPVDVLRLSDAEREPALLAVALADGRVLVDREQEWPRLQKRASAIGRRGRREERERARAALAQPSALGPVRRP